MTQLSKRVPIVYGQHTSEPGVRVYAGPTDPISDMIVTVDGAHHHLHEFELHQVTYGPAALANGATIDFRMVIGALTPTTRTPHLTMELDSTGECWLYLYETPTTSANGTQLTTYNRNRNPTAIVPNMTIWQAPTVTVPGTLLSAWIVGSGEKSGGNNRDSIEWALAASTVYLARIVAKNANNICLRNIWYEDLGV